MNLSDLLADPRPWVGPTATYAIYKGFAIGAFLRVFRAGVKWLKRISVDVPSND